MRLVREHQAQHQAVLPLRRGSQGCEDGDRCSHRKAGGEGCGEDCGQGELEGSRLGPPAGPLYTTIEAESSAPLVQGVDGFWPLVVRQRERDCWRRVEEGIGEEWVDQAQVDLLHRPRSDGWGVW